MLRLWIIQSGRMVNSKSSFEFKVKVILYSDNIIMSEGCRCQSWTCCHMAVAFQSGLFYHLWWWNSLDKRWWDANDDIIDRDYFYRVAAARRRCRRHNNKLNLNFLTPATACYHNNCYTIIIPTVVIQIFHSKWIAYYQNTLVPNQPEPLEPTLHHFYFLKSVYLHECMVSVGSRLETQPRTR